MVRASTKYGTKHAYINVNITIIEVILYTGNDPPVLLKPPGGMTFILKKSQDLYIKNVTIGKVYDDRNQPAFLNFTAREFGWLSYRFYTLNLTTLAKNESKFMTYDPETTQLQIMIPSYEIAIKLP